MFESKYTKGLPSTTTSLFNVQSLMAKSRTFKSNLTRLVGETGSLIYLLSDDGCLVFANEACLAWLGITETETKGKLCSFSCQPFEDPIEEKLRGLAVPPNLFESDPPQQVSIFKIDKNAKIERRQCTTSLIDHDRGKTLMVVANAAPNQAGPASVKDPFDSAALHQALVQVYAEMAEDYDVQSLIGQSTAATQLAKRIELAIASNVNTIICGPPGSGREHIAKVIHNARLGSASEPGRLIPLHCKIADQQLVQENIRDLFSDSFGSLKSNSTESNDCLLLLDIDKLSNESQHELFGFLSLPNISILTISTTSESVQQLANTYRFHSELAVLLSTIEINVPALQDRKQDIPLLAKAILDRDNRRRNRNKAGFTTQAMKLLVEYDWPGNIDQLERYILAASDVAVSTMINVKELPEEFHHSISAQRIGRPVDDEINLDDFLQSIERELIARAMAQANGTKSRAAKLLGISRARLLRRLGQLGFVDSPEDTEFPVEATLDSSAFLEAEDE